jgi:hypothetical protein
MSGVIKLEALQLLADRITCAIPELAGHVCVGQAPPNHELAFPSLAICPAGRWRYLPDQDDDVVAAPQPDVAVVRLGRHEVLLQLQLATATQGDRYRLEQEIEQVFFATEMHPGIVYGEVSTLAECFGRFQASFMLDGEEWEDGKAFAGQAWSYILVQATIPALARRAGVYEIKEIRLGLTEVFGSTVTPASFNTDPTIERVSIDDDGTVTPL